MPRFREGRSRSYQMGSDRPGKGVPIKDLMKKEGITNKSDASTIAKFFMRLPLASIFVPSRTGTNEEARTAARESMIKNVRKKLDERK